MNKPPSAPVVVAPFVVHDVLEIGVKIGQQPQLLPDDRVFYVGSHNANQYGTYHKFVILRPRQSAQSDPSETVHE